MESTRRKLIRGVSAGAAALALGCGSGGTGMPPGPPLSGTGGRSPSGTGGSGSGGSPPTGSGGNGPAGSGGTPGASSGGAPGSADGAADLASPGAEAGSGPVMNTPSCIVRPQQTAGPFPSKTQLDRSDIRSEPGGGNAKPGLPLRMVIRVGRMMADACRAYPGVAVDLWQCDVNGLYSGYASEGTAGLAFLRGYQLTDGTGTSEFVTIFPGSYPGRAVHLHFAVRLQPTSASRSFTSQLYFPEPVLSEVFSQPPYSAQKPQANTTDSIFNSGGSNLIPRMSKSASGWLAEFDIGLT